MTEKIWFITGTTTGLGREWAIAALDRGDRVAATARNVDRIADLVETYGDRVLPIALDVTDRRAVFDAVARAHEHFGRLDVVVNNAGYGQYGMVEELSEQDMRDLIDTNLFGAIWVTQAALPLPARAGQRAHPAGRVGRRPHGRPHARDLSRLEVGARGHQRVARAGGPRLRHQGHHRRADRLRDRSRGIGTPRDAESGVRAPARAVRRESRRADDPDGDPEATRAAILAVVDAEEPPLRIIFGDGPLQMLTAIYESRLATWRKWEAVSIAAHGTPPA